MTEQQNMIRYKVWGDVYTGFCCTLDDYFCSTLSCSADFWTGVQLIGAADKSLARPGRKQTTATEDFEFHISYL